MTFKKRGRSLILFLEQLESREAPTASPWLVESFDGTSAGAIPTGWSRWSSSTAAAIGASSAQALSAPNGLALSSTASNAVARTWLNASLPADADVSAAVYLSTLIPAQVLARASGLDSAQPSYYAVSVSRGMQVQLLRVVNGVSTSLGSVTSVGYFSQKWVQARLSVSGNTLRTQVYRPDTGQYLNSSGHWQAAPTWVLSVTDTALTGPGQAGLARPASYTGTVSFDDFTVTLPGSAESFDNTAAGKLPTDWTQWSTSGANAFAVSPSHALSAPNGLTLTATSSNLSARAWEDKVQPADVQTSAAVYLNSLVPAQVLARGSNLNTATPSYYAVTVARGLQVQLVRVVNGVSTVLGSVSSTGWFTNQWVRVTLSVSGTSVRAQVYRPDTAQFLNVSGAWQSSPTWVLTLTDGAISGVGLAGLGRPASYAGTTTFDDFLVIPASGDTQPPSVTIMAPSPGATYSGVITVQASASDNVGVSKVEFYVDGVLRALSTAAPYRWDFDTSTASNGGHNLAVLAYDLAGNVGRASQGIVTQNSTAVPQPTIPAHLPNLRIAELAYNGTPLDAQMVQLLQNYADLVVTSPQYLSRLHSIAPNTPLLVYANTSSIYDDLLTSWLNYADAHGLSREEAFYHVSQATSFSGGSPSSQPVDWFWAIYRGSSIWTDLTSQAHGSGSGGVAFGPAGQALAIGYTDPFREINVALASSASGGWSAALEYPTAVDAAGNPTAWAPLTTSNNTTAGMTHSGQITFDPPANWKAASLNGSARLYYVRFRTTSGGTAPVASTILGRDCVGANGGTSGVIPAFDYAADTNHDGYLSDAEYARRAPGKNARFVYESREFASSYGQMRFATNPADLGFRNWAVSYDTSYLKSNPLASGLFMDNSSGALPVNGANVLEPTAAYASDYAALLNAIDKAIAPKWILGNTAGSSGTNTDAVVSKIPGYFAESTIRPLADNYAQFDALAAQTAHLASLTTPSPFAVLDSLPTGGSPTDARTQLATLAYYYLIANPTTTFLDFFGGYAPATSWSQHWSPAAAYNIGVPVGTWSLAASGADPSNKALTYHVYERSFANALVLYKPLSYGGGVTGTLADASATTLTLSGKYRVLNADGTPGAVVPSITLRNGEGAILVKV